MARNTTETPVVRRVRELVEPIASDLQLDLYDVEQRGGTMRVTLDTPPGSEGSVDLDQLALATRLISRELDHQDPIPGHYTLEVTSPGVERTLRTPAHFRREIGKTIAVRLANPDEGRRRIQGVLVAADDTTATIRELEGELTEHVIEIDSVDRARTVFEWGPQPKPGGKGTSKHQRPKQQGATARTTAAEPRAGTTGEGAEAPSVSDDQPTTSTQKKESS